MKDDIIEIKVKIEVPKTKWLVKFNQKYPDISFNILSKFLIDKKTGITLFQIQGPRTRLFLEDFSNYVKSDNFQILYEGLDSAIFNIKTTDPWILNALIKTELLLIYPLNVKNGMIGINTLTSRKKFDMFLTELEEKNIKFSIGSIGHYKSLVLLTKNQKEITHKALQYGYFDIPRKISLTDFAKRLEISPSALSETLRRINKKLVKNYVKSIY